MSPDLRREKKTVIKRYSLSVCQAGLLFTC